MDNKAVVLTPEGRDRLVAELNQLRTERRPQVVRRLQVAREESEAWDNPEVIEAKNELAFVDGRIMEIESMLSKAQVIQPGGELDLVTLGSRVTLRSEEDDEIEVYTIVGSAEAQPQEGRISNESPVGKALMGHRVGDIIEVETPAGSRRLEIIKIG